MAFIAAEKSCSVPEEATGSPTNRAAVIEPIVVCIKKKTRLESIEENDILRLTKCSVRK